MKRIYIYNFFFLFFFFSPLKWSVINNSYTIWMTTGTCRLYKGKTKKNDTYIWRSNHSIFLLGILGISLSLSLKNSVAITSISIIDRSSKYSHWRLYCIVLITLSASRLLLLPIIFFHLFSYYPNRFNLCFFFFFF